MKVMNISKRSGLSTDPCAPLWLPLILSENFLLIPNLSIFYRSTNSLSISVDSLRMLSLPSFPPVLWRRCQMLLQNPGKPIAVYHIDCPLPSALQLFMHSIAYTSSRDCKKLVRHNFCLVNPWWLLFLTMHSSGCSVVACLVIPSITLHTMRVILTGQ